MPRRATHLANGSQGGSGGKALVDQLDRQPGSSVQILGYSSHFGGALRVVSVFVERQPEDEPACLERDRTPHELGDRRPLAGTSQYEANRRRDDPSRVADGETNPTLAIIDGQQPSPVTRHGAG